MLLQNIELVSGRLQSADVHKGAVIFTVCDKVITMDLPAGVRRLPDLGTDVDVAVTPGLIFAGNFTGLAFRIRDSGVVQPAGRWREIFVFVIGACSALTMLWTLTLNWTLVLLSAAMLVICGRNLLLISRGAKLLRSAQ